MINGVSYHSDYRGELEKSKIQKRSLRVGILLHELDIRGDHFPHEINKGRFGAPSQQVVCLTGVAQEKIHFRWSVEFGIDLRKENTSSSSYFIRISENTKTTMRFISKLVIGQSTGEGVTSVQQLELEKPPVLTKM